MKLRECHLRHRVIQATTHDPIERHLSRASDCGLDASSCSLVPYTTILRVLQEMGAFFHYLHQACRLGVKVCMAWEAAWLLLIMQCVLRSCRVDGPLLVKLTDDQMQKGLNILPLGHRETIKKKIQVLFHIGNDNGQGWLA